MYSKKKDVSSSKFWNNKYINNEHGWDIGFPTPIFKNWSLEFNHPNNINICIPGCGYGHDAIYLSENGFNVYAFDFSHKAIDHINKKANNNLKAECIDFFHLDDTYNDFFDYILEYTFYCAIDPQRRNNYINKCHQILKDKGKIIAIMLPVGDVEKENNQPPFPVSYLELKKKFSKKFNVLEIKKSNQSIEARKDIEFYAEYEKK